MSITEAAGTDRERLRLAGDDERGDIARPRRSCWEADDDQKWAEVAGA
jgi:hypothetical protein